MTHKKKPAGRIGRPNFKPNFKLDQEVDKELEEISRADFLGHYTFIPDNKYDVRAGYYDHSGLIKLLRAAAKKPNCSAVLFVVDMME
jgi:hypothetical protein